jgi:hypothetical protein
MGTVTLTLPASDFITTQGNLFLPILTDLAVYAVFRKARSFQASELGGAIAGLAVGFYLSSRTSFLVNLTGAGLYAAYKVIHYIYASLEVAPPSDVELLEDAFDKLKDKVTITPNNVLDADDFDQKVDLLAKAPDIVSQICKNWNDPAILRKTEKLMFRAYLMMRQELREAEEAIEDLTSDQDSRNVEIVENLDKKFYSAFKIFYQTYRHVHQMCYYIKLKLPNLQKADESDNVREFSVDMTDEDRGPFILGINPKYNMKQFYAYVNDLLRPLFEHFPKEIDLEAWKKELPPEYPLKNGPTPGKEPLPPSPDPD